MPQPNRLITIAISHYCEKARWALERLGVPFVEEAHAPLFHRLATRRRGGGQTVPVLVTPQGSFTDSTAILHYLDQTALADCKLYPAEESLRQQVEDLETLFDEQLGSAARQWVYSYLMENPSLIRQLWQINSPSLERRLLPALFPVIWPIARRRLEINPVTAASSLETIQQVFKTVGDLLQDGRSYLVGDRFTAADLTFAALATPVLFPANRRVKSLELGDVPTAMATQIKAFRESPAGAYALRLYRKERNRRLE